MIHAFVALLLLGMAAPAQGQGVPPQAKRAVRGTRPGATQPRNVTSLLAAARASSRRGDDRGAIVQLNRALEIAPNSTDLLYQYGLVAARLGRPAETVRAMTAATRLESDDPDYLYLLGVGLLWTAEVEGSTVPLGRAAELAPDRAPFQLGYAMALHTLKRYNDAVPPLERVLALDAGNTQALYLLADIAQMRGELDSASRLADRVLAQQPRHPGANLVRGVVLAQRGDYRGARAALEIAAAADPNHPRTFYQLSRVYAQLGDEQRAAAARLAFDRATRKSYEQQRELRRLLDLTTPIAAQSKPKPRLKASPAKLP